MITIIYSMKYIHILILFHDVEGTFLNLRRFPPGFFFLDDLVWDLTKQCAPNQNMSPKAAKSQHAAYHEIRSRMVKAAACSSVCTSAAAVPSSTSRERPWMTAHWVSLIRGPRNWPGTSTWDSWSEKSVQSRWAHDEAVGQTRQTEKSQSQAESQVLVATTRRVSLLEFFFLSFLILCPSGSFCSFSDSGSDFWIAFISFALEFFASSFVFSCWDLEFFCSLLTQHRFVSTELGSHVWTTSHTRARDDRVQRVDKEA